MRFDRFIRLLYRNKISWKPRYLLRIAFILQSSVWSLLFSAIEKFRFHKKLGQTPKITNPIFIIGHWRTGTTFLHQLMGLDPNLTTPSLFQVAIPDSFLVSHRYYKPIMKTLLPEHRPMDMVKLGMDEPQEDEYAIFRITRFSPLEKLVFPDKPGYFLNDLEAYVPGKDELDKWGTALVDYYTKLHFLTGKRIVSKNPFNSFRIPELMTFFPDAKFIHIYRHPYAVIPSTIHMWDIVQRQNCLNNNVKRPSFEEVTTVFDKIITKIRRDLSSLPREKFVEVKFEDFEADPVSGLQGLYQALDLEFSEGFEKNIHSNLAELLDYHKNVFQLTGSEKEFINTRLHHLMNHYGYQES